MQMSDQIGELAAAMAKAQAAVGPAKMTGANPHFKSKFAPLDEVWNACRTALNSNGLSVLQFPVGGGDSIGVRTILMHSSGQWISDEYYLKPTKTDPQGQGSALTYARRYGLAAVIGIVADEDDDGNAASQTTKMQPGNMPRKPGGQKPSQHETFTPKEDDLPF